MIAHLAAQSITSFTIGFAGQIKTINTFDSIDNQNIA